MKSFSKNDVRLVRLHLAAHDPDLLKLLDSFRRTFGAKLSRYWCPLVSVTFVDYAGCKTVSYWRGAALCRFVKGRPRIRRLTSLHKLVS